MVQLYVELISKSRNVGASLTKYKFFILLFFVLNIKGFYVWYIYGTIDSSI